MRRIVSLVGAVLVLACSAVFPQTKLEALLSNLKSPEWQTRAAAYEKIVKNADNPKQSEVKSALLDLLDRENRSDWSKESGFKADDSEAHAEYQSELGDTVASFSDWKDPRQLCVLAHIGFNSDSDLAAKLALAGRPVIPCLLRMSRSASSDDRYQAIPVLVQLRAKDKTLDSETSREISQITIAGLHDHEEIVRIGTVAALRDFGEVDMIPALREVAETDPKPEVDGQSVRKDAAKAIAAIQEG